MPRVIPEPSDSSTAACGLIDRVAAALPQTDPSQSSYVGDVIAAVLTLAFQSGASDVHFTPTDQDMTILWRVDGVLQAVATVPRRLAANVVARLKVLADLLTYRTDVPQEGRLRDVPRDHKGRDARSSTPDNPNLAPCAAEMRLSTFPTLHGEKAVVRIFAGSSRYQWPAELGLPVDVEQKLLELLRETAGALLVTGPAGSGKTTTVYACLRQLQRQAGSGKSIVTLEDPIESVLAGVSQSQVNRAAGFDYATGLRSLMRQDPDAILVGEIRDRETAETVFQACLTGHLVVTTFHAGTAAEAVCRLNDMGIEAYLLRAGLLGIVCQRLFRELCDCARWTSDESERLGYNAPQVRVPAGCTHCDGSGYRGRMLLAELLLPDDPAVARAILSQSDAAELNRLAIAAGMISISHRATEAVAAGRISPAEARRVLGFRTFAGIEPE